MIKFPYELSKERLSLLSKEDKKIYEYEHSGLCPEMNKLIELNYDINLYNSLYESNDADNVMSYEVFERNFEEFFDGDILYAVGDEEEYAKLKQNIYEEYVVKDSKLSPLHEAQGTDHTFWMKEFGLGWIGTIIFGCIGMLAWLGMKVADRMRLNSLKKYMSKLVEKIDKGEGKQKKNFVERVFSFFSKNDGSDESHACFRTIQEATERNLAGLYTQTIRNLGFLSPSIKNFNGIVSGFTPPEDSGLGMFNAKANDITKELFGLKTETGDNLLPFEPDKTKFENLKLPALPTNYKMLMMPVDFPDKAKKTNPNGSLFMKPTEEILQEKGSDIGQQYFKDATLDGIVKRQGAANESMTNDELSRLNEFFWNDLTGGELFGKDKNQETAEKEKTKVNTFKGKLTEAIDNYVRASIPIINKLIKTVCNGSNKGGGEFSKLITQLINASEGHMSDYMKKNDTVLKDIVSNTWDRKEKEQETRIGILQNISILMNMLGNNKFVEEILGKIDNKTLQKKKDQLAKLSSRQDITSTSAFDLELRDIFNHKWSEFDTLIKKYREKKEKEINNSYQFKYNKRRIINEDEQHLDDTIKNDNAVLDAMNKGMDTTYQNVRNKLSEELAGMIVNDPEQWYIVKSSRDRMNKLKQTVDTEIDNKIKLICRTGGQDNTGIGEKFKAAISKHPLRAESLISLWARYSDDLQERIDSRMRSIVGDNGNSNILLTIQQFLTTVYPNLIAIMLYYKNMLYCVELYTRNHPIPADVAEQQEDFVETEEQTIMDIWYNQVNGQNNTINTQQPQQQQQQQQQPQQQQPQPTA